MNLLVFAFRNVFRNKKRSFLTGLSIFIAAIIAASSDGWVHGVMDNVWNSYVKYQTGDVRIVTGGFYKRERFLPVDELIKEPEFLEKKISKIPEVTSIEQRIRFGILLAKGDQTIAAVGEGIELKNSRLDLKHFIIKGDIVAHGIYIGDILAGNLNVKMGEKLLIATKTSEGGLNGIKLPIAGIFHFGVTEMDRDFFFVDISDARKLLKTGDEVSEIYVFTKKNEYSDKAADRIRKIIPAGYLALSYPQQLGSFYDALKLTENIMIFFEALIMFLASFVIINTMMMAVFERMVEIGTLKALGMTDRELFINFVFEGGIIGTIGGIAGGSTGYVLVLIFSITGLDISALMDKVDIPLDNMIFPSANIFVLVFTIILSVIISSLASMIPAYRARKLTPSDALKKI